MFLRELIGDPIRIWTIKYITGGADSVIGIYSFMLTVLVDNILLNLLWVSVVILLGVFVIDIVKSVEQNVLIARRFGVEGGSLRIEGH